MRTGWLCWAQNRNDSRLKLIHNLIVWSGAFQWHPHPPLANWENNRGAIVESQEGKKGMCCRICTSWVPAAPEAFVSLRAGEPSHHGIWKGLWRGVPAAKLAEHNLHLYSQLGAARRTRGRLCSEEGVVFLVFAPQGVSASGFVFRHSVCDDIPRRVWHSKDQPHAHT